MMEALRTNDAGPALHSRRESGVPQVADDVPAGPMVKPSAGGATGTLPPITNAGEAAGVGEVGLLVGVTSMLVVPWIWMV